MFSRELSKKLLAVAVSLCCCGVCFAEIRANIRDGSGSLTLVNDTEDPFNLVGYSITFPTSDLRTSDWLPITSRLAPPFDLEGTSFDDVDNNWVIFSPSEPTENNSDDLSEGTATGQGGTLMPGDRLYLGNIWNPSTSPFVTINLVNAENEFSFAFINYLSQGDYNEDGLVDAKDYNLWRDSVGDAGPGLDADGDGNGVIDISDYDIWRSNLGATTLFGSALALPGVLTSAVSIPEPSTAILLLSASLVVCRVVARHSHCCAR